MEVPFLPASTESKVQWPFVSFRAVIFRAGRGYLLASFLLGVGSSTTRFSSFPLSFLHHGTRFPPQWRNLLGVEDSIFTSFFVTRVLFEQSIAEVENRRESRYQNSRGHTDSGKRIWRGGTLKSLSESKYNFHIMVRLR